MTKTEIIEYYKNLLIIQYKNKPKAREHVSLLADLFLSDLIPLSIRDAFDLDTAVGVQLDIIGKYAGVARSGYGLIGYITLNDNDYRKLIELAIIRNYSNATTYEMKELIFEYFGSDILLFDYKNMRMSYFISGTVVSNVLAQFVVANNILPFPMGITQGASIYAPVIDAFYGFVSYESPVAYNNSPMNDYNDYNTNYPWLLYQDAVVEGAILLLIENEDNSGFVTQEDNSGLYF